MKKWQALLQVWRRPQEADLLATLARGAGAALCVQIFSVGFNYTTQILLARWMGVTEYGIYDYAIAWGISLAFLAGLGLPTAVLRFIPEYTIKQDWAHLRGIIWGSWLQTLIASLVTASCGTILLLWLNTYRDLEYIVPLILGICSVPLLALTALQKEIVRAVQQIVMAYAPSLIIYPLVLLGVAFFWQSQQRLTSTSAIALSMLSLFLILIVQLEFFRRALSADIRQVHPAYAFRQWWKVSLPMMFIAGSSMILNQTDTLMIGTMLGAKEVGIYSAALKTAAWVNFILIAVNAISAPMFASLYAEGDRVALQRLVSAIARWMFWPALAVSLGLIVFASPVLNLFGSEFIAAKGALSVLILGQLVNVGAGSVGYLLMMTGHQNQCALVMGFSALVNVVLNIVGIHWLGIMGAALATAFSMALWNIWLHTLVVKHLNIYPSVFAAFRWR